jgi:hypothetical protein
MSLWPGAHDNRALPPELFHVQRLVKDDMANSHNGEGEALWQISRQRRPSSESPDRTSDERTRRTGLCFSLLNTERWKQSYNEKNQKCVLKEIMHLFISEMDWGSSGHPKHNVAFTKFQAAISNQSHMLNDLFHTLSPFWH